MGFAVVDVETTGFAAGRDRIIEIAVVHLSPTGAITDEWCTLLNPHRDLGPQHIHGITTREVLPAPAFADIAGDLLARLSGRVLVAHNLSFDARFLHAELTQTGIPLPPGATEGLCTMTLAPHYLPTPRRNLAACCAAAGIPLTNAHSALHDARATAALLAHYLAADGFTTPPGPSAPGTAHFPARGSRPTPSSLTAPTDPAHLPTAGLSTPGSPTTTADPAHRLAASLPTPDNLTALAAPAHLPAASLSTTSRPTGPDWIALLAAAQSLRWPPVPARNTPVVHRSPGPRTTRPRRPRYRNRTTSVHNGHSATYPGLPSPTPLPAGFRLGPGDRIAFTGQTDQPRELLQAHATAAGLVTHPENVCRWTKVVVAADPDSLSTKARKARDYRIPIITEPVFARLLAELRTPG